MPIRCSAVALVTATMTALLLTGCSAQQTDPTGGTPTPTATATAPIPDPGAPAAYDNACDGKQAIVSGEHVKRSIDHCDAVAVTAAGSTITIGETGSLVVEGSDNTITVESVESVMLLGSNNKVRVESGTPQVDDQGAGNTVR